MYACTVKINTLYAVNVYLHSWIP